ncbi:hypothetical protein [Anaerophaga thermohalophila]|uniref:hypothetical protein n=1 Tax=Anaerophaga thermohalophila TaxID=177400 RepID=UPI0002F01D78|nr:hypothetical protein [Anaerophaga thermohalophila]
MGKKPFQYHFSAILALLIIIGAARPDDVSAQNFSVSASTDSTLMFIGGQMNLTLEVAQPKDINVAFPQFNDTITGNIEIVEQSEPDTSDLGNNRISIKQIYRITSFDSGLHYIPPIEFELASAELEVRKKTKPIGLMVVNPFEEADPQKRHYRH